MEITKPNISAADLVNNYSDALYGYTLRRVNDVHTAKDIVQETFLSAWKNIDTYNGKASVKTWLFAILKNKIIDHYRKAASRHTNELTIANERSDYFFDDDCHWSEKAYPSEWSIGEHNNVESKEFYAVLNNCQSKLKQIQSAVFTMKYIDELESEEICKVLNLSTTNYWVLVHRAKVQLRACLEKNWFVK